LRQNNLWILDKKYGRILFSEGENREEGEKIR